MINSIITIHKTYSDILLILVIYDLEGQVNLHTNRPKRLRYKNKNNKNHSYTIINSITAKHEKADTRRNQGNG